MGDLETVRQQWDAAIAWYAQAQQVFEELKQPANGAVVTRNIGDVLKSAKRYEEAEAAYQQVVQVYRDLSDRVAEAWTLDRLGDLEADRQQWDAAIAWYAQAQQIFEELKQPINVASVVRGIAKTYRLSKQYEPAETAYRLAVNIYHTAGDRIEEAGSFNSLGVFEQARGNWASSLEWYQRSLEAFKELKIPANMAFVIDNVGDMFKDAKRYEDAEKSYREAIDLYKEIGDSRAQSETAFALGSLYRILHRLPDAIECYEQAIQNHGRNWEALLALALLNLEIEPQMTSMLCRQALAGEPAHQIVAHAGLAVAAVYRKEMAEARSEMATGRQLLGMAQEQHTVPLSQLEAFAIVLMGLDNAESALLASGAFDVTSVSIEERDLIEIAFGFLSSLGKQVAGDSQSR